MTTSRLGTTPRAKSKTELGDTHYENILQGTATNTLTSTSTKKQANIDDVTHQANITKNNVTITLDNADKLPQLDDITHRTLDILLLKLTRSYPHVPHCQEADEQEINTHREITLSVNEYMERCGIKDAKTARLQLNNAINTLYGISLNWTETYYEYKGKKKITREKEYQARVLSQIVRETQTNTATNNIIRGLVTVKFDYDFAQYLAQAKVMPYPTNLLKIPLRYNQHAYYLGKKLTELYNMNKGKKNEGIVSVKTLIDNAPNLPTLEEVMKTDRHVNKRIVEPLEKTLNALVEYGILASWEYCGPKGMPLTDDELNNSTSADYLKRNIKYTPNTKKLPAPKE